MTADSTPPVDLDAFRTAMREAGVEEIVEPVLATYVQEAAGLFERLSAAMSSSDLTEICATAHALRSASGNIQALALAARLAEVETAARNDDVDQVRASFPPAASAYRRVVEYLHQAGVQP
jgi:HPt (histidine-containing phosphotransfer) domain-containing protein